MYLIVNKIYLSHTPLHSPLLLWHAVRLLLYLPITKSSLLFPGESHSLATLKINFDRVQDLSLMRNAIGDCFW